MSVKKFFREVKQELDNLNYLREKIIYPEGRIDATNDDKSNK